MFPNKHPLLRVSADVESAMNLMNPGHRTHTPADDPAMSRGLARGGEGTGPVNISCFLSSISNTHFLHLHQSGDWPVAEDADAPCPDGGDIRHPTSIEHMLMSYC